MPINNLYRCTHCNNLWTEDQVDNGDDYRLICPECEGICLAVMTDEEEETHFRRVVNATAATPIKPLQPRQVPVYALPTLRPRR